MFKCLCGGGTNTSPKSQPTQNQHNHNHNHNPTNNHHTHNPSIPQSHTNGTIPAELPKPIPDTHPSNNPTLPNAPIAHIHTSPSRTKSKSPKPKHSRKKTHPYKSRGEAHMTKSPSPSHISSHSTTAHTHTTHITNMTENDYFVYDTFEFSIDIFDFESHYQFLIELAVKCLNMGPEILSPNIFFKHNELKCICAVLHDNNGTKVPQTYTKDIHRKGKRKGKGQPLLHTHSHRSEKEHILLNNLVGFCIAYPHSNCRPYPDSVWMIGWLCVDTHRIKSIQSQNYVIDALVRSTHIQINPYSTNYLPTMDKNGLGQCLRMNKCTIEKEHRTEEKKQSQIPNYDKGKMQSKANTKNRDKGIGIYAPYYHKKAQLLYESLGFEKIAKIGNYYSTDRAFFEQFYADNLKNEETHKTNKKLTNTDAYLYCRGDLAHCRLLLGMEYFNYKKWPKKPENNATENVLVTEDEKKSTEIDDKTHSKKHSKNPNQKRTNAPKILEEYLQSRIADYHAKQKEQLIMRNKMNNASKKANPKTTKPASVPALPNSNKHILSHHSSHHNPQGKYRGNNTPQNNGFDGYNTYAPHRNPQSAYIKTHLGFVPTANIPANAHMNGPNYNAHNTTEEYENGPNNIPIIHHKNSDNHSHKSRHSSLANSQQIQSGYGHHSGGHSGGYYNHRGAYNNYNRSSHASVPSQTPTYDVTHSGAVYYHPHLSNHSTATYTTQSIGQNESGLDVNAVNNSLGVRGTSFYSMPQSTHSNASHHSHHSHHTHHSLNSNQSDPYLQQTGYHNQRHHSTHGHMHYNSHKYMPQKYDKYDKYIDDGYHNANNRGDNGYEEYRDRGHKGRRDKRYQRSSRHKKSVQ